MFSKEWMIGFFGAFLFGAFAQAQCNDPAFTQAIKISDDGHLEVRKPLEGYSYNKKDETTHRFTPELGPRLMSMMGRPLLRGVKTDSQNRVQSIEFLEWGHNSMLTPEYTFTTAYKDGKCYIEKWMHKDGTLLAHTGMCHELMQEEESCGKSDCESKALDAKFRAIIKKYGGSLDHMEKVEKKFKMKVTTYEAVRSGLYQSAIYLERCNKMIKPMEEALKNKSLWETDSSSSGGSKRGSNATSGQH